MDGTMAKHSGRILALAVAGIIVFVFLPFLMADQQDSSVPGTVNLAADSPEKIAAILTCLTPRMDLNLAP